MPQLAQALELRMTFGHILESLPLRAQLSFLGQWPSNSLALQVFAEVFEAEMPVAVWPFGVNAIVRVDDRHHRVAQIAPGIQGGGLWQAFRVVRTGASRHGSRTS